MKKDLLLQAFLSGSYTSISGQITAGANELSIGFVRGKIGSSTATSLRQLYDATANDLVQEHMFIWLDEFYPIEDPLVFTVGRLNAVIDRIKLTEAYFVSSAFNTGGDLSRSTDVFPSDARYRLKINNVSLKTSSVLSCDAFIYPLVVTPSDVNWVAGSVQQADQYTFAFSETAVAVGDYEYNKYPQSYLKRYGFESGKTYDFTLEYKIDAIITEDGVQTF